MKHTLLLLTLFATLSSTISQAQVLKKIGEAAKNTAKQGVETLKKNTREGVTNAAELLVGTKHDQGNEQSGEKNNGVTTNNFNRTDDSQGGDKVGGAPHWVDHPTIEVDFEYFEWAKVTNVFDDIFAIQKSDNKGIIWNFYNVKTAKAVSTRGWRTQDTPRFNNGICAVCDTTPAKGSSASDPK